MRMGLRRLAALFTASAIAASVIILPSAAAAADYTADFTQLVKDNADTTYGTASDVITLDAYTTLSLTYEGTYVSADGVVYLTGGNGGRGAYTNASYIEFTAPSDGTAEFTAYAFNYYLDGTYKGYNKSVSTMSVALTEGQKLQIAQRVSGTYVSALSFESTAPVVTEAPTAAVTDPPAEETEAPSELSLPVTWDFSTAPAAEGENTPVLGGNAEWDETAGEVKFPSDTTTAGTLSVDFDKSLKGCIDIEFDVIGHSKALGRQWFNYSIKNSEETIVDFGVHPYDSTTSATGLVICGSGAATAAELRNAWTAVGTTHVKTVIDYTARKVTVTVGGTDFTGDIPEGTVTDTAALELSSNRSKTAGDRYISIDNIAVSSFTSTEDPAEVTVTDGYDEAEIAGYPCRVKAQTGVPAVIYLASELRAGTDNCSQLYDAKPIFDKLGDGAALIAPQTETSFSDVTELVNEVRTKYNATTVTVIGQSESAAAALSSGADKIITIAGTGSAVPAGKVWAFAGYQDGTTAVSDVKTMVNTLQSAGVDTRYTEYPYEKHKINSVAAEETGLTDWILTDVFDAKTVDLVLFSGQSNMAGRGDYDESITVPAGQGYEYHSVTEPGTLSAVTEPFGKYENNDSINDAGSNGADRRSGDMVAALMKAYYDKTGVPMVGVQASRGGTTTKYWLTETQYNEAIARYNEAAQYLESAGYTIRKKLLVWCQGEGDADSSSFDADTYKSNTLSIFEKLKNGTGIEDTFIVRTGHYNINYGLSDGEEPSDTETAADTRYIAASEAQAELAAENERIYEAASFLSDYALQNMRDKYHYYQPVYNTVGTTAGETIAAIYDTGVMYATGAARVTKRIGETVTEQYEVSKTYTDDTETVSWSVSGVDGVTIDSETGVLSVPETAGTGTAQVTATLTASATLPVGTTASAEVEIKDFAAVSEYEVGGAFTIETGKSSEITLESVTDADGNDITAFAAISGFTADGAVSVDDSGKLTADTAGVGSVSFTLTVDKLGYSEIVTRDVKTGAYELTASGETIDVSGLVSYGADTYRVYSGKKYADVTASDGSIANPYSGEVTVVPIYRLNYTSADLDGYTTATGTYDISVGYGLTDGVAYNANDNGVLPTEGKPIHIDIPYGSYDMNILRRGGVRCDVLNDGMQIINNTVSSGSQNRPSGSSLMYAPQVLVRDGSADIEIKNVSGSNERIATVEIVRVPDKYKKQIVWIAGDSESANYYPINADGDDLDSDKIMMTGFGMQLPRFLSADKYKVANWGQPSATIGTWSNECMESVVYRMERGDTIIIDFGINDAVSSSNKTTVEVMEERIAELVKAAQDKGVQPILVSPLWNSKYQSKTYFTYDGETNAIYDFAAELGVPCIDLNKGSMEYKDAAIAETGDADWAAHNYHVGDNLHQTQYSALLNAAIIAGGMKRLGYTTTDYAYTYEDLASLSDTSKGEKSGVTREYSIAALDSYITVAGADVATCVKLTAVYYDDGTLKSVDAETIRQSEVTAVENTASEKTMYWDSLESMIPIAVDAAPTEKPTEEPTTAPSPTPTPAPTDEPTTVLYTQDFESYSVGDTGGWTSPAGTMAVKEDSENGLGKYQTVVSGKSGTCRSGYVELPSAVTESFVFECDYKSSGNANVSDLELLEAKGSVYSNHGVYSNASFVFTMARPKNENLYVINNKADDSGFTLASYTEPVFVTDAIENNPWLHIKVVGNFDEQTVIVYITSLDGSTEYYRGKHDMNVGRDKTITSWKCMHMLSPSTGCDTCIDNISVRTASASELAASYHKVTITCGTEEFEQYVADGESVVNIPDVSLYGDSFDGWTIGDDTTLYSSEELAAAPITSDCTIKGNINESYIEALSSVEFNSFPTANELVPGEDENTYGDNEISLTITGEQGTSLVTDPDERVTDYAIDWTFDGFRILDGTPTGETGDVYCDSYGLVEITETAQSKVNFRLKKTAANYYGTVTAKVTYNGKAIEVTSPLVLLGDKSGTDIYPTAGYTSDYSKYDSALAGYEFKADNPLFCGDWEIAGSDASRMTFTSDDGNFMRYSRSATGNSAYGNLNIGSISGETMFEQDIRFNGSGSFGYSGGAATAISDEAFSVAFDGSKLTFNGNELCAAAKGTWYHITVCADPTSKLTWAKVCDMSGNTLGTAEAQTFKSSDYASGKYYRLLPSKSADNSIDFNNLKIYKAEIDESTIDITAPETVSIPESGTVTASLSVTAATTAGDTSVAAPAWAIDDEFATGVSIDDDGTLTVDESAGSGELPIRCTIGGKSKTVTIKLIGDKNSVAFTNAPTGILLSGSEAQYTFTAELRSGAAETIEGDITYTLRNADNTADIAPDGITMNSETGILTVSADAEPQTIGILASSGDASKFIKVVIYDLSFSFGTTEAEGYTTVSASTYYSESRGYGFEGTASETADGASGSGAVFKLKLESGKVYNVKAEYEGTIRCERIDSSLVGFDTASQEYSVAIFGDGIMDITLTDDTVLKRLSITEVEKTASEKPQWFTIGDSTVQQNGSWAYTIASVSTTDLSKYPELAKVCSAFYNSGKAGEQHKSFYANGRLNSILTKLNPGDVVSLSGMGTNDSSSTQAQFKAYDKAYIDAIIDMGGYVILGSYTPTGNYGSTKGKVYDADTMTFKGMRTNAYDLAIREMYEEYKDNDHVLGFLDIGAKADELMTADVKAAYDAAAAAGSDETAAREAANEKAEEMMAWWKDYNHYYVTFSNYILPYITTAVADMIAGINN